MPPNIKLLLTAAFFIVAVSIWYFSFEPYKEKVERMQRTPTPTSWSETPFVDHVLVVAGQPLILMPA